MGRNMKIAIVGDDGEERASHKLSYGTKLFVKEGGKVLRGDKLFEWDPYTLADHCRESWYSQIC